EVVLPAVTGDWTVMNFCPKSNAKGWWADRDIVLAAVAQCADALGLADKLMWEDRDLVLSAVKTSYEILTKCPGHLKSDYYQDRDMVMEAVQQDAMALKEFNEEFFSDLEVVAIAARQNIVIIDSVQPKFTKRYLEDHTIALLLVEHDVQNFERIPDILKQEKDILLAAIKQKGSLRSCTSLIGMDPSWERTSMGWFVVPDGFRNMLGWIHKRYGGLPIYVTENGCAVAADTVEDAKQDHFRARFLEKYTGAMLKARDEDGVNVRGYFCWSMLDNFEWCKGYAMRFGLIFVDFKTLERTPKQSFHAYQKVIRAEAAASTGSASKRVVAEDSPHCTLTSKRKFGA
ncbi:unnamed protein product, partial [Polarella glacialis]